LNTELYRNTMVAGGEIDYEIYGSKETHQKGSKFTYAGFGLASRSEMNDTLVDNNASVVKSSMKGSFRSVNDSSFTNSKLVNN